MLQIPSFLKSDRELIPVNHSELQLFNQIKNYLSIVSKYEDPNIQQKARDAVPWKEMTIKSVNKLLTIKQQSPNDSVKIDSRDILIIELLEWFKNRFFKWFDAPECGKCHVQMSHDGFRQPNPDESQWSAARVEHYSCNTCGDSTRFPRYNNPEKLLETKIGRCGEFANCFTLICRSLGYDARLVLDLTDHVWTEVYSNAQKRWLHCDSCENCCDSPLVYEIGWGKKLTFCMGLSKYQVCDVTWRYSKDHDSLRQRRAAICREEWINAVTNKISNKLQYSLSIEEKNEILLRRLTELIEFIQIPNYIKPVKESELKGRDSGSLGWRLARSEIGVNTKIVNRNYQFDLKRSEQFSVSYNCVNDHYVVNGDIIKNWETCTFMYENICRKVENDWKMVYLSRNPGSDDKDIGTIIWKFNFPNECNDWNKIKITINCKTFENGHVKLILYSDSNSEIEIIPNKINEIVNSQIKINNCQLFVEAKLSNGIGTNNWQHSQLFRQSLINDSIVNGFIFDVFFN